MNTTIIIVTYNGMQWLKRCLSSIPAKYDIVVVDNNSSDETVTFIKEHFSRIILFEEKENLGFGQANNKGISHTLNNGAQRVFLLNQDAYLNDDTIDKLIAVQKERPEYGILSPIHTNAEGTRLDRKFSNYVKYDMNPDFYSDFVLHKEPQEVYEVPFVNAAGWLISRDCLMNVGGFDPIFFHYGEDRNYSQRLLFHNFKIGVVPNCFMVHDREDRPEPVIKAHTEQFYKSRELYFKTLYADVNIDNATRFNELDSLHKKISKRLSRAKILCQSTRLSKIKRFIGVIESTKLEIKKSVAKNTLKGPHYLEDNL